MAIPNHLFSLTLVSCIFIISSLGTQLNATESVPDSKSDRTSRVESALEPVVRNPSSTSFKPDMVWPSWAVGVGVGLANVEMDHKESLPSGLSALGERSKFIDNDVSLFVLKEFFVGHRISLSAVVRGGIVTAKHTETTLQKTSYVEKSSGSFFAAGLSGNVNFFFAGIKLQSYLGLEISHKSADYDLSYSSVGQKVNVLTATKSTLWDGALGLRVLDRHESLMTYIQISYLGVLREDINRLGGRSGSALVDLSAESQYMAGPLKVSIGIGYYF